MKQNKINELRKIFNQVDPIGIYCENNYDEYDPEIKALLDSAVGFNDINVLESKLVEIFTIFFEGIDVDRSKLFDIAKKIIQSRNFQITNN